MKKNFLHDIGNNVCEHHLALFYIMYKLSIIQAKFPKQTMKNDHWAIHTYPSFGRWVTSIIP